MAGIISNVDKDVQELRKLKNAIEDVKKSLKGINIKVDIDITNGLQAQLKSLTEQYHALVSKIAEAEGKILLSTKRLNDASEKIIQAQEKVSKVVRTPTQVGNMNIQTNTAETESVRAQAKAYDDLRTEINDILGTRGANVKRMVDEMNAIRLINAEIKKITKSQGESSSLSSAQQKRLEQLNNSLLTHKTVLSEVRQTLSNNVKLDNVAATSMNGLSQSLSRMRIAYRELTEEERNSPFGKELLASINQADAKIKELDATIGNHQRNVGNYGKQWNGLSMSIQQVGRELPSLAYGPKVFFSAISNNLPILADEIKRARTEYELLKKSGQSATPVWKQVVSSLFGWQTALTVGITLLTLYGDKIVDWVGSLFTVKKVLSETYQSLEDYQKKVGETSGTVISTLERLSQGWKRLGGDIDAQKKFILENKDAIDSMGISVNDAAEAERLFNINKDTFIMGLLQRAKAASTMELAAEEYKKAVQKMMEADAMPDKVTHRYSTATNVIDFFKKSTWQTVEYNNPDKLKAQEQADNFIKSGTELVMKYAQFSEEERKTLESIGIKTTQTMINGSIEAIEAAISLKQQALKKVTDHKEYKRIEAEIKAEQSKLKAITGEKDKITTSDKQLKQEEQLSEQLLSLRRKNQQDEINLMADGTEKKLAQIDLDYRKELDAIRKQEQEWSKANGGKLTEEQSVQISLSYSQAESKRDKSISDVNKEELEAMNRYLKEYGTFQQKKEAIAKEYADKIAKATTEGDKKFLQKEMEEAIQSIDLSELKQSMDWEQVFGNLDKVSTSTLKKLKANLKDFISNQKDLSPENLKELVDAIERIDDKVSERNPFEAMSVSFKSLKSATDTQREAQEAYNKALKEGTDEEQKNAKATLEGAKNNKQKALYEANIALHKGVDEIGQYVEAGNQVIGIMETLGIKTPEWLEGTMSGFGEMLNGLEKIDLMKPVSIVTGGLQTVKGALTSIISLGGLIPGFGGADYSQYNKMVAQYEQLSTIWDELIDKKKEYIDISYGSEALKAGQEALDIIDKSQQAQRNLARARVSSGASAGSHSIAYRQNKGLGGYAPELYKYVSQNGNYNDITSALLGASEEQLKKVREQMPEMWAGLDGDFREHLDNIISGAEQTKEVLERMKEAVTGMSFDEFRSGYVDLLSDLDSTNEDFADNFEKYLQNAIFESLLANKYKDQIQDLYDTWSEYGKDGLSSDEAQKLRDMQKQLTESMIAERDKLMTDFGWESDSESSSQSSTSRGFQAMSQDTGEELNGRFTALQIAGEEIRNQNIAQSQSLNLLTAKADTILSVNTETRNIADDTRDLIAQSYLELVQISENTGNSAKYLKDIKADIAEMKKNTSKL